MGELGEVEGVIGTPEGGLQLAQQGVDRLELREFAACRTAPVTVGS